MSKVRAPLLSFQATGSVARSVTYSRSGPVNRAGAIPTHRDARTLPQLYQRWRFYDAPYYWRTLSAAQRAAWESAARPHHMSGWAWFLSSYLRDPDDQVLWLRLDTFSDTLAPDSSGKRNHAGLFGPIRAAGVIDACRLFTLSPDFIAAPHTPSLCPSDAFTLMGWFRSSVDLTTHPVPTGFFYKLAVNIGYALYSSPFAGVISLFTGDGVLAIASLGLLWSALDWHHLAVTYDGLQAISYIDGFLHATSPVVRPSVSPAPIPLYVGTNWPPDHLTYVDDARIYTRALSAEQVRGIATTQLFPPPPD